MFRSGILLATGHNIRNIMNNRFDSFDNVMFGCIVVFVILNFIVQYMAKEDIFFSYLLSIKIKHQEYSKSSEGFSFDLNYDSQVDVIGAGSTSSLGVP